MKTHLPRVALFDSVSYTQCPAVATRLWYCDCTEVAVHQCGRWSAPMKNTLPVVLGRLTFFAVLVLFFSSPIAGTTPGLLSAEGPPVDTCFAGTVVSTLYGVALIRFALAWPYQNAATCLAARFVLASGVLEVSPAALAAGAATAAAARSPAAT